MLIADIRLRGLMAAKADDRPINAILFEEWVEKCLAPTLSEGELLVVDNMPPTKGQGSRNSSKPLEWNHAIFLLQSRFETDREYFL